ncbi:serine/threonine protein kinase [Streptomyces sp. NPDC004327]|uniref:serine/threonine protein kinase n=1 Tax=Streptomyces sp. NPDC004327 TaxID=3364699 RepID=UPI0036B6E5A6
MDDYSGRVLADRYRLPLPPADAYEHVETRAFDTYSGQEVRIRQVPLPEVVDAELLDGRPYTDPGRATRRPADPAVRRAVEAAQAAARIPDHPRLDQVFDVFAEAGSLWIVSESVPATSLAGLLAEGPLSPYRAAEIGADLLTALRALHAHGWTHRNVTARTVLVCDDGRVVLTGLAAGAAEEALCGYAPVPPEDEFGPEPFEAYASEPYEPEAYEPEAYAEEAPETYEAEAYESENHESEAYGSETYESGAYESDPGVPGLPAARTGYGPHGTPYGTSVVPPRGVEPVHGQAGEADQGDGDGSGEPDAPGRTGYGPHGGTPYGDAGRAGGRPELPAASGVPASGVPADADVRAARAGAIAAYRAGARAAASIGDTGALPVQRAAQPAPSTPSTPPAPSTAPSTPSPGGPPVPPEPRWWARTDDDGDDADLDDEDDEGGPTPPPRAYLAGSWSDGPHASRDGGRSVPAGGGGPALPALPAGYTAATPAQRPASEPVTGSGSGSGSAAAPGAEPYRGPVTRLAAERARQTRMALVGAVTERWAPEQAGPVHEHWRLAPPIGPATDLWALGALLYRAVQGHAPYPEDSAAELVQLVCAEPPAFAEESGPLRPVVESLLRQDPTERPDVEELSGWLRSLVRSAPEPDAGLGVVPLPSPDAKRLPIVRRRGELVRRRRKGAAANGRHRHARGRAVRETPHQDTSLHDLMHGHETARGEELTHDHEPVLDEIPQRAPRAPRASGRPSGSPRSLGRTLLVLILLLLGGAVAYAVLVLPGREQGGKNGSSAAPSQAPTSAAPSSGASTGAPATRPPASSRPPAATTPPAGDPSAPALAPGYDLREDPEGFQVGVPKGWRRSPINDAGQVRFTGGDFTLVVVPGRDAVQANGDDPLAYQSTKERELTPWRESSWSSASGLRRVDIGRRATAEGQFTWQDSTGREVFVRNLALIDRGRYHVVQVIGPSSERDKVSEIYEQATKAYRVTR